MSLASYLIPTAWPWRLVLYSASRRDIRGFPVAIAANDTARAELACRNLDAAIALLETHYARGLRQIRRQVQQLFVAPEPHYPAQWVDPLRMCVFSLARLTAPDTDPARVASWLVHEAMHGRLARWGIGYSEPVRHRVELACTKAQLDFVRQLPNAAELCAAIEAQLQLPEPQWSDAAQRQLRLSRLRQTGAPAWVVRALEFWYRRRAA